jgi:hypothetical protein
MSGALRQNTGIKMHAPINGGFGLNGRWKQITVNADFAYSLGKYMYDNTSFFYKNPVIFAGSNTSKEVLDYWKKPGDNTKYPNWADDRFNSNRIGGSDFWISNASFLRLKNLTVSYNFDRKLLEKTNFIRNARVFFTGRNLLTITRYTGTDPEPAVSFDMGRYMNSRQYQFGVEVIF